MSDDDTGLDELFQAARRVTAPPGTAVRGWSQLAAQLGLPGAAAATPALGKFGATKLAVVAGLVAAVITVAVAPGDATPSSVVAQGRTAPVDPPPVDSPPHSAPAALRDASPPLPVIDQAFDAPAASSRAAARRSPGPQPGPRSPTRSSAQAAPRIERSTAVPPTVATPAAVASDALRVEAELLGRAWLGIRDGDDAQTQRALTEHASRFPAGALVPERRACELVLRCRLAAPGAVASARAYLRAHPGSHLADRVAAGCDVTPVGAARSRDESDRRPATRTR